MTEKNSTRDHFPEPPHTGGGIIYDSKEKIMDALHYTQQAAHSLGEKVGLLNPGSGGQVSSDIGNTTAIVHSEINKEREERGREGREGEKMDKEGGEEKLAQDDTGNITQGHRFSYVLKEPKSNIESVREMDRENIREYSAPQDSFGNVIKDPRSNTESVRDMDMEIPPQDRENVREYKALQDDTGNITQGNTEIRGTQSYVVNTYKDNAQQGTQNILTKAQDTATYLKEKAQDGLEYMRDKVQDSADYLRELGQPQDPTMIDPVYDNPRTNADYLKEKAQDTANYIKEKAQDTVSFIKEKVEERYGYQNVKEKKSENIE